MWLTGFPDFRSGVNQRRASMRENTGRLLAQVDKNREGLSTTRKCLAVNDLQSSVAGIKDEATAQAALWTMRAGSSGK